MEVDEMSQNEDASKSKQPAPDSKEPSLHLAEWIQRYANAVYALAYSRVGDYHYAQDIAQETFLKAYLNEHFLKDKSKAGSWLYTIAARTSADWVRANKVRSTPLDESGDIRSGWLTEEIVIERERRSSVWQALEKLDEASRTVLILFHMNDWSLQELGDFLNIGVKAVDSRLRRAREKLREQWLSTVEQELHTRKPAAPFQQKLLQTLSEGNCDRLIVKEGLQLSGNMDGLFAMTAKRYRVPFLLDVTAKTDSTNIQLRFAKGRVILNWDHNPEDMKYNDPADGTSEHVSGVGCLDANEWGHIQWYIGEKLSAVLVNGRIVHCSRGCYSGLIGPIGIGPAWSSIVTIKKLRIEENPKITNEALDKMMKLNEGDRFNLRMIARWSPDRFNMIRKSFEAGNPHLMLTIESVSSPSFILERAAASDAPDLIPLRPQDIVPMLQKGLIIDLMPFAKGEPGLMDEVFSGALDNCIFDGKLAVLPFEPRVPGFLFKKDRFDEAGIAYPESGWTWDQFLDAAIRLTKRDSAGNALQYGLVIQKDWAFVESMVLSNGGSLVSPDGSRLTGYLDSDATVEAVQHFVDLFRVYKVTPIHQDPILQPYNFYNEKIGMFGEGSWMAQEGFIKADNRIGAVGMPVMPGGTRATAILVSGYAISARSIRPDIAWDMLKRFIRPDEKSATEWARHNVAWSKTMADRSGQSGAPYLGPFLAELPFARKRAQTLNPHLLHTSLTNDILHELIVHGADVRETLETLARAVENELLERD